MPSTGTLAALAALATTCLSACGPSQTDVKSAPVEVTPPLVTAAPSTPPVAETPVVEPPDDPQYIAVPGKSGCVLQGTWMARGTATLTFRDGGPSFAKLYDGQVKLYFPLGARPAVQMVEVEADGLALRGFVPSTIADLRAATAFWMNDFAIPTMLAKLDWSESTDGHLTVTTPAPANLEVLSPPLSAKRPCSDIRLGHVPIATDTLVKRPKSKKRLLQIDKGVDIALTAGGPTVARIRPGASPEDVLVLETKGKSSRIHWEVGTLEVVGWVATRHLAGIAPERGWGSGYGRGLGKPHIGRYPKLVCPVDTPLVVESSGERLIVGVILAGTIFETPGPNDTFAPIIINSQSLSPTEGSTWKVRMTDLSRCRAP